MPDTNQAYPDAGPAQLRLFEQVIKAGRAGQSHAQIAAQLQIGRSTLKHWLREHPDFARVMTQADDYALAWWEALGQRHAETREGNATMIMFVMKNRFDRDYDKDALAKVIDDDEDIAPILKLSRKSRKKLRKVLKREAERAKNSMAKSLQTPPITE